MKELIHFAHGNGFPSPCYRQLLLQLNKRFDTCFIDRVGHSKDYPVTDNWAHLAEEVALSIQEQSTGPVIALGHSLGGVLSYLASMRAPELFKGIILLDSPIINNWKSQVLQLSKMLGFIDRLTPALRTRGRKRNWKTREEALAYLKTRGLFSTFSSICLEDYIDYGLVKTSQGYTLRFDPNIEYQIYRTIPHHLPTFIGKSSVPIALIYGTESSVVKSSDLHYMKKHILSADYKIEGTHMFPMEQPELTADLVCLAVDALLR